MTHKSKAGDKVTVMWFYRPEDTVMGRKVRRWCWHWGCILTTNTQPWNGADELYRSGHTDQIDLGAITSVCNVMTLRDYLVRCVLLARHTVAPPVGHPTGWSPPHTATHHPHTIMCAPTQAKPQLEEHDFFWRFTYVPMANGGRFEDEAAATYASNLVTNNRNDVPHTPTNTGTAHATRHTTPI